MASDRETWLQPRGVSTRRPARRAALPLSAVELGALYAAGCALASSLELPISLERGLQALLATLPVEALAVLLPDWGRQEMDICATQRLGGRAQPTFRRIDLAALPPAGGALEVFPWAPGAAPPTGPLLAAPIRAAGCTLGLLVVALPAGRPPLTSLGFVERLGEQLGQAVRNARLFEATRTEADRLAALGAVGSAMRRPLPVQRLLQQALGQLLATTNLDLAVIYLREEGEAGWTIAASAGIARQPAARLAPRAQATRRSSAPLVPRRPLVEEDLPPVPGRSTPRCLMHLPLRSPGRVLGVLTVGSYRERHFAPGALELLAGVAAQIALSLDNALLHREARLGAAELARANLALEQALRSKDQFLANVTHELRRPLAPARLVLETLLENPPGRIPPERQQQLLRNALNNLDSLNALVSELLDAVRVEQQARPADNVLLDLGALARRTLAAMQPLGEERGLEVRSLIPRAPVHVRGDPQALGRVIANLLSNAVKFNRQQGSILLQLEESEGRAVLSVTDTGIGIPRHARPHIFERFYQADGSSTRMHDGLGLGLFIAREIVEQHGGQIRFDTEEGVGTTFTVTLPVA